MRLIAQLAQLAQPILRQPGILRVRRNHALEHATIHLLSRRVTGLRIAGRSDGRGFTLWGKVPTEYVEQAATHSLERMKRGERNLAVHPNCGTNLVTQGFLATLAAYVGLGLRRERIFGSRFALVTMLIMLALVVGQPLGMALQRHFTTEGDPGDLHVADVRRREVRLPFSGGSLVVHEVVTRGGTSGGRGETQA